MKAIVYTAFGETNVIKVTDVKKPDYKADEVLIKTAAVSVNQADIKYRKGLMQARLPVELPYIPGLDVAGTVEAVGSDVTRLKVGDKVFGGKHGEMYAEYVALKEAHTNIVPSNVSLTEAAAFVVPLVTAYSFLVEYGDIKAGQKVFIQGISGGTGNVMLQLAKSIGAYVIGTASGKGIEIAKSLGADEVIDYKNEDFVGKVHDVDIVIDLVGGDTQVKSFATLKKGGKLYSGAMPPSQELAQQYGVEARFISSAYDYKKLDYGKKLVEEGKIKPRVVMVLKLEDAAKAQDIVSAGNIFGKVVLEIN